MSLRSRAFLSGLGRGFFQANNERRQRMEERLFQMSNDRATRERELAKSEYMEQAKAAQQEELKYRSLRSAGDIDVEGNFTPEYFDKIAYAEFKDKNNRAAEGMSFEQFRENFARMQPKKFIRNYKDQSEIAMDLKRVYESIETRQHADLSRPVLTGFDRMLAGGVDTVIDTLGGATGLPIRGATSPEAPTTTPSLEVVGAATLPEENTSAPVEPIESVRPTFGIEEPVATQELETTYKTYDDDGTEHIVKVWKDGSVETTATGLSSPAKVGTVEMKTSDLKDPVDKQTTERIRDGIEATRLIGEIFEDTSIETSASIPKAVASVISVIEEELVGTFGSDEEKRQATVRKLNAAFGDELAYIDSRTDEELKLGASERDRLVTKVKGLEQNKRALAYALVRLNRASGRFNGQELQEQLNLLFSSTLSGAASVLRRAQQQVQASLENDMQTAAASIVTTKLIASGDRTKTKNDVLGWVSRKPIRDPKNGAYYIMFRDGPYKYAYMTPNGGVTLRERKEK